MSAEPQHAARGEQEHSLRALFSTGANLSQRLDPRQNSLNFLRLVFAIAVIVSHGWAAGGYRDEPRIGGFAVAEWGVIGFFVISGYLITRSRAGTTFPIFFARRVLRIYPGYLVCLLAIVLVFAPVSVMIGPGTIHWENAARFVGSNLLLKTEQGSVSSTLIHTPSGSSWWDISLWTLFYEFVCYVAVGALLSLAPRFHRRAVLLAFLICGIGATLRDGGYPSSSADSLQRFVWLGAFFFAGALFALYADHIRMSWWIGGLMLVLLAISSEAKIAPALGSIPAAYIVLLLGAALPFRRIGQTNDISYGMYIYAFPVQQILNQLHGSRLPVLVAVLVAVGSTVPFALASWKLIERPVLNMSRHILGGRTQESVRSEPSLPTGLSSTDLPRDPSEQA